MNTFLPLPDFAASARVLDRSRLGKQRVEAYQLVRTIKGESEGWKNHPCTRMWQNYCDALVLYGIIICKEWISRGYSDSVFEKLYDYKKTETPVMPHWFGNEAFHASHRANLLRKDPKYYGIFKWKDSPLLEYVWPE